MVNYGKRVLVLERHTFHGPSAFKLDPAIFGILAHDQVNLDSAAKVHKVEHPPRSDGGARRILNRSWVAAKWFGESTACWRSFRSSALHGAF